MGKYDAVIIGTGLAGLSVAAWMSHKGKRVIILDPASATGGSAMDISLEGIRFSPGPAAIFGFEQGGPLRTLCSELGIILNLAQGNKPYQIALPDRRITVFPDKERTLEELRREFPREIDSIGRCYKEAHLLYNSAEKSRLKAYLVRRRTAGDFLASFRLSRGFIAFLNVQSFVYFGMPVADLPLDLMAMLVSSFPQAPRDDISGIASALEKVISGNGGTIKIEEPWPEIIARSKTVAGVTTGSGVLEARTVLINTLEPGTERRWLLGIRPDVLPVGMLDTVLCLPDYDKPINIMTITLSADEGAGGVGNNSIRALRVSFYGSDRFTPSEILFDRISSVIPFLRDFIETGGEQDLSALSYPVDKIPAGDSADDSGRSITGAIKRFKNIVFVPDRYIGIGQSVRNAQQLMKRIA